MNGATPANGSAPSYPALPARVLIAGGGVAALEAMLALRTLAEDRVSVELLAPDRYFTYTPLSVAKPFGLGETRRFELDRLVRSGGALRHEGMLAAVHPERRSVRTSTGAQLRYDFLLLAMGARRSNPLPGAVAFGGEPDVGRVRHLLAELEQRKVRRLAFALTGPHAWSLPLYELALMTADHLERREISGVDLTLVTPEDRPLGAFGDRAAELATRRLDGACIEVITGEYADHYAEGTLWLRPGGALAADRVITLAAPEAPVIPGLATDQEGFLATDPHGRVTGVPSVYAAGDITSFPIKQGGIAAQQADTAAEAIAAAAGALVTPRPFQPVLRGLLLTGTAPAYLRSEVTGGGGQDVAVESPPLWWPPAKIVARYLGPFLAEQARTTQPAAARRPAGVALAREFDRTLGEWHELGPEPERSATNGRAASR